MKAQNILATLSLTLTIATIALVHSEVSAQDSGYDIMKKNDQLKEPSDASSEGKLILINKNGNKKQRTMKIYIRKNDEGYDSYFKILSPADVAGMKFLMLARKGDDEQRMFLPALGKSRKISGSGKDGKFLGSDIYFYDLEDHDLDDFTYKYIKDETWEGKEYYVVEAYPKSKSSPYSKTTSWVCKDDYFVYKMVMYDKKQNRKLKTMTITETTTMQNIILPVKMEVNNHQDNHQTIYLQENNKVNIRLDKGIFTVRNLEN
jgi:hypothetical protein